MHKNFYFKSVNVCSVTHIYTCREFPDHESFGKKKPTKNKHLAVKWSKCEKNTTHGHIVGQSHWRANL